MSNNWFRWERDDLGERILKVPAVPSIRLPGEDNRTPRICVAPSPALAASALRGRAVCGPMTLYQLTGEAEMVKPTLSQVPDAAATGEQWILSPTKFVRVDRGGGEK